MTIEMTGTYGSLTIIERDPHSPGGSEVRWLCSCECGRTVSRYGTTLRSGETTSCGCTYVQGARSTIWNGATIETLRRLWDQGLCVAAIGLRMGLSKNAILGKVHRLHLDPRPSPIRGPITQKKKRVRTRTAPPKTPAIVSRPILPVEKLKRSLVRTEVFRAPIGKAMDTRRPGFVFPDEDEIERHIALHGITRCPIAAVDETTGVIPPADRGLIAAHQQWREQEFWATAGKNLRRAGARGASVMRKRGAQA